MTPSTAAPAPTGSSAAWVTTAMNGGAGNDIFVFAPGFGNDTIAGFDANAAGGGQDLLDISALGITAATFAAEVTITVDYEATRWLRSTE